MQNVRNSHILLFISGALSEIAAKCEKRGNYFLYGVRLLWHNQFTTNIKIYLAWYSKKDIKYSKVARHEFPVGSQAI